MMPRYRIFNTKYLNHEEDYMLFKTVYLSVQSETTAQTFVTCFKT